MKIVQQYATILPENMAEIAAINVICGAADHCYDTHTDNLIKQQIKLTNMIKRDHLSPFEHVNVSVELQTDIAVYKALTRHRHCAFTIESTHFIDYKDGLTLIEVPDIPLEVQEKMFSTIEQIHQEMLQYGTVPARSFLPQAQAARLTMTTNFREWFTIFDRRKGKENTTGMWQLMSLIMAKFNQQYPFMMSLYDHPRRRPT